MDYPNNYVSFKNSKKIDDEQINTWIEECINTLKGSDDDYYMYISSGNTMVLVTRNEDAGFDVRVCKDFEDKFY